MMEVEPDQDGVRARGGIAFADGFDVAAELLDGDRWQEKGYSSRYAGLILLDLAPGRGRRPPHGP